MSYKSKFMKGLMGASALTLLSTGSAFAAGTTAGTDVDNTFSLNYSVGAVPQDEINNDATPTTFKVDRLINVTVATGTAVVNVSPNQENAVLDYTVTNNGNGDQAYFLSIEQAAGDTLDSEAPTATGTDITYSTDGGTTYVTYDPASPPVLAPDDTILVRVTQDIPSQADGADDGDQADIYLVAQTRDAVTPFGLTAEDTDGNDAATEENVFGDEAGPSTVDDAEDGEHSSSATYLVASADIDATKEVSVVNDAYDSTCPTIGTFSYPVAAVPDAYNVPGACVQYVIRVTNDASATATAITLTDDLPDNLVFREAVLSGSLTGSLSAPAAGTACDGTAATCRVEVTAGSLAGKAAPADPAVEGYLVIRATIE